MGTFVDQWTDVQIATTGMYPLVVSRRYDSSRASDGPLGAGWSSSLTVRLYYAAYLKSAPSTYSYEADLMMPDGTLYTFTSNGGAFSPPLGRYDTLVRNGDGTWTFTLQHTRSVYRFNADGSAASLTDDYGNILTYSYDANGRVSTIADASGSGRSLQVTWGTDGRIASVNDNAGRVWKYFYENGNGTLTSMSDPLVSSDSSQRTTYYQYTSSRFGLVLSRIEDRWHRVISEIAWYSDGKLKSYTAGRFDASSSEGEKYTYSYGTAPLPNAGSVTKTDSLGSKTFVYSFTGLVSDANATYDAAGLVQTDSREGHINSYTYDGNGNVLTMTQTPGYGQTVVWTYTYDTTFPDRVKSIIPNRADWAGTVFDYNPPGLTPPGALIHVWRVRTDQTTKDLVATMTYDEHGHLLTSGEDGYMTAVLTYNAAGDIASSGVGATTTYGYDSLGRMTSSTINGQTTTYAYDALDRLTTVTLPKPTPTFPLNFTTTYSYDNYDSATGLVFTNVTDANGRVTKTGYDALGQIVQSIDAAGNVTKFTYQYGLLKKITDANNNETTYGYNGNRDLSTIMYPDGAVETYSVSTGVLIGKTDRKGQGISYSYDGVGRLTRVSYTGLYDPYGSVVGQEYQYQGQNLAYVFDHTPSEVATYQYTYDSSWRRTEENIWNNYKTTYTYVNAGWPSFHVASYRIAPSTGTPWNPQTVSYGYDGTGRVSSMSWNWIPSGSFEFTYGAFGSYSRITFPNGQARNYSYDNQGRLTNITNTDPAGGSLASFDYSYDYDWTTNSNTMLGQRTGVWVSAPGTNLENGQTKYRYDAAYQLTRVDHPNGLFETFNYDAIGNRTSTNYATYSYYTNGTNPLNGHRLRTYQSGFPDMLYDANGNLTGFANLPNLYVWDYAGRLTSSSGTSYTYDYLGRRRTTSAGNGVTKYISYGLHTVAERNPTAGVATDYLMGPGVDEPLAKIVASGAVSYYGVDGLGSVVLVTSSSGVVTDSSSYDAWGSRNGGSELFGYTGRETGGLGWFNRARNYSSGWGRFVSEDPLGIDKVGALEFSTPNLRSMQANAVSRVPNLYAYGNNDPISYTDPSGLVGCNALQIENCMNGCNKKGQNYKDCTPHELPCGLFTVKWTWCECYPRSTRCPPCPPTPPSPPEYHHVPNQHGCPNGHWHYYKWNQNPTTCQCFPQRLLGGCLP